MGGGHRNGVRLFVHGDSSHHYGRYANRVTRRRLRPRQWSSPVAEALGKRHRGQKAKSNGRFVVSGETSFRTESRIFLETLVCRRRSVSFGLLRLGVAWTGHSSTHTRIPTRPRLTRILALVRRISPFPTQLMTVLSFADSGRGISNFTLDTVANKAIELGFEKEGALNKKPAQRADLQRFFNTYGVKAFSRFKDKFEKEKLLPPEEYLAQKEAAERAAKESEFAPVTEEEYIEATQTADAMEKKWRLFKKCVARIPSVFTLNVAEPFADIILFLLSYVTTTLDRAASASNPTSTTMCKALAAKLTPATS